MPAGMYLVTGSTDGIGRQTVGNLYRLGHHVIIHGRNATRIEQTRKYLEEDIGGSGTIHSVIADFSKMSEVHRMAEEVKDILGGHKLTCLINNAGVYSDEYIVTDDGMELTWQVNVVAPFILTALLWKLVEERIVNVASLSASHSIDFSNLQQEKGYSAHGAYSNSKLCNIMFNHELHERLQGVFPRPTVNALDPGTVNTKMLITGWGRIGIEVADANDETYLATSPDVKNISGEYFVGRKLWRSPAPALDSGLRKQLFDVLEDTSGVALQLS